MDLLIETASLLQFLEGDVNTIMADGDTNGEHSLDVGHLRSVLLSNSTKKRSSELHSLREKITNKGK